METLNLGDKVTVKVKYVRTTDNDERYWDVIQIKETTGIFVGYRNMIRTEFNIHNAETDYAYTSIDNTIQGKCALIAINKKQIIKVPLNAL
jgi:hypothetical protein